MATLDELETALVRAHRAGDTDSARKLAAVIQRARASGSGVTQLGDPVRETLPGPPEDSLGAQAIGAGETALALGTGMTGGSLGMLAGALKGLAEQILGGQFGTPEAAQLVEQAAASGAEALTYSPRTPAGQRQTKAVGSALQQLVPLTPLTGELSALGRAGAIAAPAAEAAALQATEQLRRQGAKALTPLAQLGTTAQEMVGGGSQPPRPPGPRGFAGGSAVTTPAEQRVVTAEGLPVPVTLTRGAATRDPEQLAFEKEQLRSPLGEPLRVRTEENNLQALQNFDALIDMTDAAAPDLAAAGSSVVRALSQGLNAAKAEVRVAYKKAELANDMADPVTLSNVATRLMETQPEAAVAPILKVARDKGVQLGIFEEGPGGTLVALPTDLKTAELLRRSISNATGYDPTNSLFAGQLKGLIDEATNGLGGTLYKQARMLRRKQARKYENRAVVARLLQSKRGTADPKVSVDQVFRRSILSSSPEEIRFLKRVLLTSGKDGAQAWKELQGATVRWLRDESTKGLGLDSNDVPIVSPNRLNNLVKQLDSNGRLDTIFDKKTAQVIRDLNEVVRYVNTVPPGTLINNSGTAAALMAAIAEAGATGALTGLPVPVVSVLKALSNQLKNAKLRAKINDALNPRTP